MRAVRLLAAEGLADKGLLAAAPRRHTRRGGLARTRAVEVAAALISSRPGLTLAEVGAELTRLRHYPPQGGAAWAPSSVKALLGRAQVPLVSKLRPTLPWPEVAERMNAVLPRGRRPFTTERRVRAMRLLASEGLTDTTLLDASPRQQPRRGGLARLRHHPPQGGATWAPSSVKALLGRARAQGLLPTLNAETEACGNSVRA